MQCAFAFVMGAFAPGFICPTPTARSGGPCAPRRSDAPPASSVTSHYGTSVFSGLLFAALVDAFGWSRAGLPQVTLLPLVGVAAPAFVRSSQLDDADRR